ncbi:MAG TPA: YggS family pyridoxal phosphate-dependent enzyme [Chitinophagales bacterium]|nr:YggS family pyridoxal phosphate-dependent enzyme [Chitinophagales bacterium]
MAYSEIKKYCEEKGVTLVAISKTKTPEEILAVYDRGQRIFGENKVQELVEKHESPVLATKDIQWHLVGHLQTNKVKYIAPYVSLIHSIDSWKLLEEVNKQAEKCNRVIDVLLQIHIAQEETKFGLSFSEAKEIFHHPELKDLQHISIKGLMGMATLTEDETQIRKEFRSLKTFFDEMKLAIGNFQLAKKELPKSPLQIANCKLQTLSMGMSSDYKTAIEEGSTMVRIGSAIFGERNP